jgi:hypothetical protein
MLSVGIELMCEFNEREEVIAGQARYESFFPALAEQ